MITKEAFKELLQFQNSACVSIYIPTHRSGMQVNEKQDVIVFKNALQAAQSSLQQQGLTPPEIEKLLKPALKLVGDDHFWNNQAEGLAVFISQGFDKIIHLPFTVPEKCYVNATFYLTPLLPAMLKTKEFYLLALSKHDAKFYQGNEFGLQLVEVEGLPNGMDDVVHFEEKEGRQLFRKGGGSGAEIGGSHGHEGPNDDKANITTYFQEVDRTLMAEVLHDKNAPLLLAGVEYLIPIYKSVSKYKPILEEAITGNQEREAVQALFEKAKKPLIPYFEQRTKEALEKYYTQIATAATSSMPEKVIPASHYAQVSELFIAKGQHLWGTFNKNDNQLEVHEQKQPGDACLLNQAAVQTLSNGGNVYMLDQDQMPKDSLIAASFRF
ncbi:hypothetical protein IWX76_000237 [Pedobacter sp. CAN_A7]|uniref:baeRF7 domain-containing protein n=1 Tax=Pedobacter sp. CAN_A7 TaxID=2787722 RepID=UPI0018CBCD12